MGRRRPELHPPRRPAVRDTMNAVLTQIDGLRANKPTMLRLTNVYNSVIGDTGDPSYDSPAALKPSEAALRAVGVEALEAIEDRANGCPRQHVELVGSVGSWACEPAGVRAGDDGHGVGVAEGVAATVVADEWFEQGEHQPRPGGDASGDGREAVGARVFGVRGGTLVSVTAGVVGLVASLVVFERR